MKSATKTVVAWMNAEQAAAYLGIVHKDGSPNMPAFYVWKHAHKPKAYRLGRRLRFRQVDLDALVEPEPTAADSPMRLLRGGRGR